MKRRRVFEGIKMMKLKNGSQPASESKLRSALYPALSFGLILAWLCLKFQVDSVLRGSRETVFYPLMVIAGFPDSWLIAVILGAVMVFAYILAMRHTPDAMLYNGTGCVSISLQVILLLVGTLFFSSSVLHMQSLTANEHMYQLMKGNMRTIGGFAADIVMECDSLGLICYSSQAYIQQGGCFATGTYLAIDPETQSLMFHVDEEAYPVTVTTDEEFSRNICGDLKHGLERG
jgi:hypothetical protein